MVDLWYDGCPRKSEVPPVIRPKNAAKNAASSGTILQWDPAMDEASGNGMIEVKNDHPGTSLYWMIIRIWIYTIIPFKNDHLRMNVFDIGNFVVFEWSYFIFYHSNIICLVVTTMEWIMTFHETVGNFIIPTVTNSIIFQRGWLKPPTSWFPMIYRSASWFSIGRLSSFLENVFNFAWSDPIVSVYNPYT